MASAILRGLCLLVIWLVLSGLKPLDVAAGAVIAGVAAWISVRLLPPGALRVHPFGLAIYLLRMMRQSITAGIDVAWRALDPRLLLRPGFITYRSRLAPGTAQSVFCTMTSLLPGTLPCRSEAKGVLIVHCLDVTQPVMEQLAAEEARFVRALGGERDD